MIKKFKQIIKRTFTSSNDANKRVVKQVAKALTIKSVGLAVFMATKFPPREYLLAPWLPLQGLVMVYAARGVGKTHFALGTAYAVATGGRYLKWNAPKAKGVLIIDGEMPAPLLHERLQEIIKANGGQADVPIRIITPDMQEGDLLDLSNLEHQDFLEEYLDGIDLIIVDNLATVCRSGRENDSDAWLPIQQWLIAQRARGRSVLLVHHAAKGGQMRGSSAREDVLDTVVCLQKPADYDPSQGAVFEVHFEKNRSFFGAEAEGFKASLKKSDGMQTWDVEQLESSSYERAAELLRQGIPQSEIAKTLGIHKSGVSRYVARAKQDGII